MSTKTLPQWKPTNPNIRYWFEPTDPEKYSEVKKAKFKNQNIPVLQMIYQGSETATLGCCISQTPAWTQWPNLVNAAPKQRFNIDFNHIRQRATPARQSGDSVDKSKYEPSEVFRQTALDTRKDSLMEFLCCMPVNREYHRYITQDSAMSDITLLNYKQEYWPWALKSKVNYDQVKTKYDLPVDYEWLIDHLSNIDYPSIHERLNGIAQRAWIESFYQEQLRTKLRIAALEDKLRIADLEDNA